VTCPYIENPDEECSRRMTLDNIEEVMAICGDSFTDCEHYVERLTCNPKTKDAKATVSAG